MIPPKISPGLSPGSMCLNAVVAGSFIVTALMTLLAETKTSVLNHLLLYAASRADKARTRLAAIALFSFAKEIIPKPSVCSAHENLNNLFRFFSVFLK